MRRSLLIPCIALAVIIMLAVPVAAVIPSKNPLPNGQGFETTWKMLVDLEDQIISLASRLSEAEEAVEEAAEVAAEGDAALKAAIKAGDGALQGQLNDEITGRQAADTTLQGAINAGDASLQAAIGAGDKALQTQLDNIQLTPGPKGETGDPGISCWDLNGNSVCDKTTEDINKDTICDVQDCRGQQGPAGPPGSGLRFGDWNGPLAYDQCIPALTDGFVVMSCHWTSIRRDKYWQTLTALAKTSHDENCEYPIFDIVENRDHSFGADENELLLNNPAHITMPVRKGDYFWVNYYCSSCDAECDAYFLPLFSSTS